MKTLSFLFSDQDLKIGRLDKKGSRLENFGEFPLPRDLIVEGKVKDPQKLGQFLIEVKTKTKLKDRLVAVGLSEMKASTHSLLLPDLTPAEIDNAIKLQADSFLPFPYTDEYLDWMLIEKTKEGKSKVLVSAVPKNIIDDYTLALEKAGFGPIAFETTSLSLLRLLPPEGKKLSFAAEVAENAVVLILGHEGNLEACSVIRKPADLLETIKKMADFYFPENGKKRPQKIYLCGKSISQNLADQIKKTLKLEPILLKTGVAGLPEKRETELAVLLSLAKKEVAPPQDERSINILPPGLIIKYQAWSQERKERGLIFTLIFLLLFLNLAVFFTFWEVKAKNDRLGQEIKSQETRIKYQLPELVALSEKAKLINMLSQDKNQALNILEKMLALPSKTEISGFNFDAAKKEITVGGRAATKDDLLKLKQELEKETLFTKVFIPLSALEKEEAIEFKIRLSL